LRTLFERSGLRLSDLQLQQFWTFHQLLRRRNAELDLTRLHAFDTMVLKHYVDCALVATLVDLPSPLLDLGSGAGFPGIPLKIVRPDVHVLLGEPRVKRVAFLEEAIEALGLRGIEVVPQSIGARFDQPVRGVHHARRASMPATLARVAPWLAPVGRVLFMKGPGAEDEMAAARRDWSDRFRVARDVPYSIPQTPHARRLVVWERLEGDAGAAAVVPGSLWGDPEAMDEDLELDRSSDDAWPSEIEDERRTSAVHRAVRSRARTRPRTSGPRAPMRGRPIRGRRRARSLSRTISSDDELDLGRDDASDLDKRSRPGSHE
jgi:16S rRNA (guanine(527)-N(7))-methyltransferase RsmG